ncbi:MAG: leucine-rich repeat domain-containing protein, partial [Anaerolineales bacterium]
MPHDQAYYQAEKKIEEALKSGATELNFGGKRNAPSEEKLSELPESLQNCTQLTLLSIHNKKLTKLPRWLGKLEQLQHLDITNNKLTMLPESIGNLKQLKYLSL